MQKVLMALLVVFFVGGAPAQPSVTATIQNFNRTGTDFSFDIYARSTGSAMNLGWSSFFFYFNSGALSSPTLSNINPNFNGTDYAPMTVTIVNSNPPRLGVQIFYTGPGPGHELLAVPPNGERICTVRLTLTNGSANSDISWDAGGSYANTWILSKDTVQVSNTINGVGSSTNDVSVANGWNILSVPVVAVDMRRSNLFPGATTPAYGYNGSSYTEDTTLYVGKGYWMKFGTADTLTVFGTKVSPSVISVVSGWNIIGPLDFNAQSAAITSTPSGIVITPYYGYDSDSGYTTPGTLKRGKGYWVKTSGAGTLDLSAAAAKIGNNSPFAFDNWITIEIEDNNSVKSILYLAKPEEMHGSFELPPPAPSGVADVRYSSNTIAEPLGQASHLIHLNSVTYPIKMRAKNLGGMALRVKDIINGSLLDGILKEGTELTVVLNLERIEIREVGTIGKQLPTVYELNQNYPNPFNPTTIIKFALPKDSRVAMSVYNILGQKVADLVNAEYVAGYHQVEFNASDFASGMYLYKLEAGGFVQTKKMLILK